MINGTFVNQEGTRTRFGSPARTIPDPDYGLSPASKYELPAISITLTPILTLASNLEL